MIGMFWCTHPEGLLAEMAMTALSLMKSSARRTSFSPSRRSWTAEQQPGRYLLSGSQQPHIRDGVGDSLLGRAAYRTMRPLTLSELRLDDIYRGWDFLFDDEAATRPELERRAAESGAPDWRDAALTGGFPQAVATQREQRRRFLDHYVEVFANRDIREILPIESSARFEQFLRLVATRTGQELKCERIVERSRYSGYHRSSLARRPLAAGYLVELIPPYSRNAGQRVIKAPKLFMGRRCARDGGRARNRANRIPSRKHDRDRPRRLKDDAPGRAVYHWRLASGQEVDFVLELNGKLLPVEIKATSKVGTGDARHPRDIQGPPRRRHPRTTAEL